MMDTSETKKRKFLTAEWQNLIMANYEVDPAILKPYVPAFTELDFWEGTCYVSLVGFKFANTRVLGFKIPFHVNFEEFNLRFYVRYNDRGTWKRGTVFIMEIVPKHAITFVANTLYREHYVTMPMRHRWETGKDFKAFEYQWKFKGNWQHIKAKTPLTSTPLQPNSEAAFITEHYWGYTKFSDKKTSEYEVEHPSWNIYNVLESEIHCDTGALYGDAFAGLQDAVPKSVFVAEGSEIAVLGKKVITQ